MESQKCTKCGRTFTLDRFPLSKLYKNGHVKRCKDCVNNYNYNRKNRRLSMTEELSTNYYNIQSYFKQKLKSFKNLSLSDCNPNVEIIISSSNPNLDLIYNELRKFTSIYSPNTRAHSLAKFTKIVKANDEYSYHFEFFIQFEENIYKKFAFLEETD